ncbi:mechanosensitive ion channel [Pauljensenia sp. UMB0018B]|uniref:Mechanosensitive ion channel protein MscS n=1 Tax=Schaalia odontolytica TaxID=1660 RepID=A0A2I1HY69_9ACTO|nr:mechanosensitive ion channel domain-containing protein [Schaalia odontolytica]MDK7340370.1 mechanosensitive ion channel [Pauljensenia sp. UMB0018B]PKY63825.1 mechanosensitive ion channel protein MscS [Schaalia odontolytica]
MTMTSALGALAQASDALTRAIADPQSGAEAAVATTIDLTLLILGPLVGAFVGVVVSVLLSALARKALSKAATASSILARVRRPGHFTFAAWGAWAGLGIALINPHLSEWNGTSITTFLMHVLLIVALACLTWMAYAAAWVFEDAAKVRQDSDQGRSRRFETQAQVLRRLTQSIVVVVGIVAIIGTFEVARQAMTTVLASAGVISVIFGLAAQQTLGNVFAGLQLAFTDAIRVGDVVVAGEKKETGSVEEITLSYLVVRIWDERRLIIPSRYFTQTPFENWTRRAAAQLGTVELKLDWSAPMTLIRAKVEQLLTATDLWDGRTWGVQITDSDEYTVTVRVLVSAKNSGHLSDLRAYMREQIIAWIVAEEPWARPAQRIEPRQTVTVEQDMSRERIARLAAELAGISGTNEAVAATGTSASHTGTSAGEQSSAATGGAASAISASGAAPAAPKDPAHAARMVAARRKAKRARRRAMADRQRELAEGGPSASRDETQVISKSALRKIIEAAGNANPQLTQTLTATSIGRGERFFSGSAEAEARAAALEGPGEEAYAEREAEARRAQERREAHKRREAEALDPEATLALAAVGVEPVVADNEAPENEGPEAAQDVADAAGAAADSAEVAGAAAERADEATVKDAAAGSVDASEDAVADASGTDSADEKPESAAAGSETADDQAEGVKPEADVQPADAASAEENAADVQPAPAQGEAPADAGASADSGDSRAAESQEDSAPAEDAEREGAPAPDAPEETGGEEEAQASSEGEISPDEQETTPIPARETSVKHPVQVPPPVRTGRPVMTDTVQAIAPALAPPPAPTPAEMAASCAPEDEADEPAVHPGWYAVAEEARLDAETRPTPTVKPARVSIMDLFPAVAPTGAEADMLRAVTGQIPVVEPREPKPEDAESAVADKAAIDESVTDEAVAPESAPAEDLAPEVEAPEVEAAQKDAAEEPTAEATIVMDPVEAEEAGALDSDATQVLPAVDEPVDETLVMPAAAIAEPASEAAKAEDASTEGVAAEEEATAKKETAKKAASTKAGAKKAPAKKAPAKKASTAKKGSKKSSAAATKTVKDGAAADKAADATPEKDAKAPAKKATAKKPAAKKGAAKKEAPKKAAAKKTSNAGPATNE